jgi:hypothetical protein
MEAPEVFLTVAERNYRAVREAQRRYYRKNHPNPKKPTGRPPKAKAVKTDVASEEVKE